jgi:hypothetical protein
LSAPAPNAEWAATRELLSTEWPAPVKPGLYRDLTYDQYAQLRAVRSSDLKGFARSPLHARHAMTHPAESAAMILGQALHVALLEPERFDRDYVAAPALDRRTVAGKATWADFQAANGHRIVLKAEEMEQCRALADAALQHPTAGQLLAAPGLNEASLVWHDAERMLACKARLDRLCEYEGYSTVVDLKSARDASPRGFAADAARFGYHVQAAHYLAGADALAPVARRFVFVVVEKDPPHAVACYELDEPFLAAGRAAREAALVAYANAEQSGVWPGYPNRISTLYAPSWLKSPEIEEETF